MNPEVKAKWLKELRNPENKQTKGCLQDENGFCCLGILTDIYVKETGIEWLGISHSSSLGIEDFQFRDDDSEDNVETCELPSQVVEWAGLDERVPTIRLNDEDITLISLNDEFEYDFLEIADIIEEQL